MIDSEFVKVKLTIPISTTAPSKNGAIYSKGAFVKAMSLIENTPIINSGGSENKVLGVCKSAFVKEDCVEIEGVLWARNIGMPHFIDEGTTDTDGVYRVDKFSILSIDL